MKKILFVLTIFFSLSAQFTDSGISITALDMSIAEWGDFDNDGNLDLLIAGDNGTLPVTELWQNNGGSFTNTLASFLPVRSGSGSWGDFDNDGDLDVFISGEDQMMTLSSCIYRNDGGGSFALAVSFPEGVKNGDSECFDFDCDGDLDILFSGEDMIGNPVTRLYQNMGACVFSPVVSGIYDLKLSSLSWADFDNNNYADVLISGLDIGGQRITRIFFNIQGTGNFIDSGIMTNDAAYTSCDTGDIDGDGDYDLILTGDSAGGRICEIWSNEGPGMFMLQTMLDPVRNGSSELGDYNNDGLTDIALTGDGNSGYVGKVYYNSGMWSFTDSGVTFPQLSLGAVNWADHDNDGDLDLVLTGNTGTVRTTKIYNNTYGTANNVPTAPSNLAVNYQNGRIDMNWLTGSDSETAPFLLTHNIKIDTLYHNCCVKVPMADENTGFRRIVEPGNTFNSSFYLPKNADSIYFQEQVKVSFSVQTVDAQLAGSQFASLDTLFYTRDLELVNDAYMKPHIELEWELSNADSINSFTLQIDDDINFGSPIEELIYPAKSGKKVYQSTRLDQLSGFSGLNDNTDYYWRIRPDYKDSRKVSHFSLSPGTFHYDAYFTDIDAGLTGLHYSRTSWGDYDSDGDLDLAVNGYYFDGSDHYISKIYRNDAGTFSDINAGLRGLYCGSIDWGDFDNDGDLDIIITGHSGTGDNYKTDIYMNDSGAFTDITAGIPGVVYSSSSWADFDSDGDLDLLLTGRDVSLSYISKIYRNDAGTFSDINAGLTGVGYSSSAWSDFDNDGDQDIVISGYTGSGYVSKIYRNDQGGTFTDISAGIENVGNSSVSWGDYDSDGDPDLLIAGYNSSSRVTRIYNNNAGIFSEFVCGLPGTEFGSSEWGDYDNDGDLDILLTGINNVSQIYEYDSGLYSAISAELPLIDQQGDAKWGDFDNDNDLDIIFTGHTSSGDITEIFRNNCDSVNTIPAAPSSLSFSMVSDSLSFSFTTGSDDLTPVSGLTYNMELDINGENIVQSSSNSSGFRQIAETGNNGQAKSWKYAKKYLVQEIADVSFKVQSVDNSFKGSSFASKDSIIYMNEITLNNNANVFETDSLWWAGTDIDSIESYSIEIDDDSGFGSPFTESVSGETRIYFSDMNCYTDLLTGVTYYWRLKPVYYNSDRVTFWTTQNRSFSVPMFTEISNPFLDMNNGDIEWGDYDNDGDLDIIQAGNYYSGTHLYPVRLFRNNNGNFQFIRDFDAYGYLSDAEWGDYDCDGDLDILFSGHNGNSGSGLFLYKNDGGIFTKVSSSIEAVSYAFIDWVDYDCDGDLDVFVSGRDISSAIRVELYRNDHGSFELTDNSFRMSYSNKHACGDFDNDGDPDLVYCGYTGTGRNSGFYRNDITGFTEISGILEDTYNGSLDWGDYDSDGDLDLLLAGNTVSGNKTVIYRNDGGSLTEYDAGLRPTYYGDTEWVDYDCDGDLDIFVTGRDGSNQKNLEIYKNTGSGFLAVDPGLPGYENSVTDWGDYDNDGDLDFVIMGIDETGNRNTKLYRNNSIVKNTVPSAPAALYNLYENDLLSFHFSAGSDNESAKLTYNVHIDSFSISSAIKPSMSDTSTGYRKIYQKGNIDLNTDWTLNRKVLPQIQNVYVSWMVQSLDNCYAGSEFASKDTTFTSRDLKRIAFPELGPDDQLLWEFVYTDTIASYTLQIDDDIAFAAPIEETVSSNIGKGALEEKGTVYYGVTLNELAEFDSLKDNTAYYWRVKPNYKDTLLVTAYNTTIPSFVFSSSNNAPNAPVSGFNPSNDDLTTTSPFINWNAATDPDDIMDVLYYEIEIDTVNTFVTVQFSDTTSAGITSVGVSPELLDGYRYYYRVRSYDDDNAASGWSAIQQFITLMPPQSVKISSDGFNVSLDWDDMPINAKGVVYTVYGSDDPYSGFVPVAVQLTASEWSTAVSGSKKFYRVTSGSSSE